MRFLLTSVTSAIAISTTVAFVPASRLSAPIRSSALYDAATGITGTVKWYNAERGFGFIAVDDGSDDMYVHATGLETEGPLMEDDRVSFVTVVDRRTNKPKAVNVVYSTEGEAAPAVAEEPAPAAVESVVEQVAEVVEEKLNGVKEEAFQRARLQFQLEQKVRDAAAAEAARAAAAKAAAEEAAAAEAAAKEAEEKRVAEEAAAAAAAKAAAEEAAAKEAEEKRLAEEAAAKEAEEKRLAEEAAAAAAAAAKAAEEAAAKELGFTSAEIMKIRQQPKSPEDEAALAAKYGAMELGEKAFAILADLRMIDLNPDPDDPSRDTSKDDEDI